MGYKVKGDGAGRLGALLKPHVLSEVSTINGGEVMGLVSASCSTEGVIVMDSDGFMQALEKYEGMTEVRVDTWEHIPVELDLSPMTNKEYMAGVSIGQKRYFDLREKKICGRRRKHARKRERVFRFARRQARSEDKYKHMYEEV